MTIYKLNGEYYDNADLVVKAALKNGMTFESFEYAEEVFDKNNLKEEKLTDKKKIILSQSADDGSVAWLTFWDKKKAGRKK